VAPIRGDLEMVEATALLRDRFPCVELHIIGQFFPESLQGRLLTRVAELDLTKHVRLYGRLPLDEALREVESCDIGLALPHPDPNYVDSPATKMFEYMSLRLPVVVSNFPMWKSIVDRWQCGVAVDPLSPRDIADAIAELAADPKRLRRLGENGRSAVLDHYSWTAEERKLLCIYEEFQRPPGGRVEDEPSADSDTSTSREGRSHARASVSPDRMVSTAELPR